MSYQRTQLVDYLKTINVEGLVLDLGVGSKPAVDYTRGEAKRVVTVDIDEQWNPEILHDLNQPLMLEDKYDFVFLLETAEHLWRPEVALLTAKNSLKLGGTFVFSSPWVQPYHDKVDYCRLSKEWWEKVLTENDFQNIETESRDLSSEAFGHLMQCYRTDGLRMSKIRLNQGQYDWMREAGYMGKANV